MSTNPNSLISTLRAIVAERYEKDTSPLLLADLGHILRQRGLWQSAESQGKSLRQIIEDARDPDLVIVRDKNSPAYIAVATAASKEMVEQSISRRNRTVSTIQC